MGNLSQSASGDGWIFRFERPGMEKLFRREHCGASLIIVNGFFLGCFFVMSLQFWWINEENNESDLNLAEKSLKKEFSNFYIKKSKLLYNIEKKV